MLNTRIGMFFDPNTYRWTITLKDKDDNDHPFAAPGRYRYGSGEHWFVPIAFMMAAGEYYGLDKLFTGRDN